MPNNQTEVLVTETNNSGFQIALIRGYLKETNEEGIYRCPKRTAEVLHLAIISEP